MNLLFAQKSIDGQVCVCAVSTKRLSAKYFSTKRHDTILSSFGKLVFLVTDTQVK
jgi:hypothetical protein